MSPFLLLLVSFTAEFLPGLFFLLNDNQTLINSSVRFEGRNARPRSLLSLPRVPSLAPTRGRGARAVSSRPRGGKRGRAGRALCAPPPAGGAGGSAELRAGWAGAAPRMIPSRGSAGSERENPCVTVSRSHLHQRSALLVYSRNVAFLLTLLALYRTFAFAVPATYLILSGSKGVLQYNNSHLLLFSKYNA